MKEHIKNILNLKPTQGRETVANKKMTGKWYMAKSQAFRSNTVQPRVYKKIKILYRVLQ